MATRYEMELDRLAGTYNWAVTAPLGKLTDAVQVSLGRPLIAVGSGGAATVTTLAAMLHEAVGDVASSTTPLQLRLKSSVIGRSSILLISASGRNSDILSAFRYAAAAEPKHLVVACGRKDSPLSRLAAAFRQARVVEGLLPVGREGFLATNSILAFSSLLIRAYAAACSIAWEAPDGPLPGTHLRDAMLATGSSALRRDTFLVLYGGWGTPAAVDIESKFSEASLGRVLLSDYRHFAHGRHNWLVKRPKESAVIALVSAETARLAERTLRLIPGAIPKLLLESPQAGPWGAVQLIAQGMFFAAQVAGARGVDPAKPGVPLFGRRIYHLGIGREAPLSAKGPRITQAAATAIRRKCNGRPIETLAADQASFWVGAYKRFMRRLRGASFGVVVLDYDGTLCDPCERAVGMCGDIIKELRRLCRMSLVVGIATGRGRSVRDVLRQALPKRHWKRVVVGYYSGADIATLDLDDHPRRNAAPVPSIAEVGSLLGPKSYLGSMASVEIRPSQITILPHAGHSADCREWLFSYASEHSSLGLKVCESDHSFDVLAPGVSKLALVNVCADLAIRCGNKGSVLCIGDKGAWPGNDSELLSWPYSLSAADVSRCPDTCWNIAPAGFQGVQASLSYLRGLRGENGQVKFKSVNVRKGKR